MDNRDFTGHWNHDLAQNFPTWTYSYDGQMKRYEDYAYYNNGNSLRRDVTRFAPGVRGGGAEALNEDGPTAPL